ncbi:hypothetical protein BC941DRAFT_450331 [Chlamydoabsidia padenii]|nr:hypothetical protein BC941DRAFT_450331 [Chlamydoabsidia padenii]
MSIVDALKKTRSIYKVDQATSKNYLMNKWVYLTPLVMSGLNHAEDFTHLWKHIDQDIEAMDDLTPEKKLMLKADVVAKQRDTLFKGMIPYGAPKVIIGINAIDSTIPKVVKDMLSKKPIREDGTWQDILAQRERGRKFFDLLYGSSSDKMRHHYDKIYPDLGSSIENFMYAYLLSDLTFTSAKETSFILVAGCYSLRLTPLLRQHILGAKINGATKEELEEIYDSVKVLCSHYHVESPLLPDDI